MVFVAALQDSSHVVVAVTDALNFRNLAEFGLNGVLGLITQASVSNPAEIGSNLDFHVVADVFIFLNPEEQRRKLVLIRLREHLLNHLVHPVRPVAHEDYLLVRLEDGKLGS